MSWKQQIVESFIKGVGKTTAAVVVVGVVSGVWYFAKAVASGAPPMWKKLDVTDDETQTKETTHEECDFTMVNNRYKSVLDTLTG